MWLALALALPLTALGAPQEAPAQPDLEAMPRPVVHLAPPRDIDDITQPESEAHGPGMLVRRRGLRLHGPALRLVRRICPDQPTGLDLVVGRHVLAPSRRTRSVGALPHRDGP